MADSVTNKGKSAVPPLFNDPEVLSFASDKVRTTHVSLVSHDHSGIALLVLELM